jgi:ER membrane protein complex subunit 7
MWLSAPSILAFLPLALGAATTTTTTVTFIIPPTNPIPNPYNLPSSTRATLSTLHAIYSAPLSISNTFVFRNVTSGSYLVDVHCATHAFAPLRLDVTARVSGEEGGGTEDTGSKLAAWAWETYRGNEWDNKGEAIPLNEYEEFSAFSVKVLGQKTYFMERTKCRTEAFMIRCRGSVC